MTLLSFHNDETIKQKYLTRLHNHARADEIVQGQYWEHGKGCAVGCTIHCDDHSAYETILGLPEWLAYLEDTLFEKLSNAEAKSFAVDFLEAIPVGVNLDRVKWQFCTFLLQENIERVLSLTIDDALKTQVVSAIRQALACCENALASGQWDESAAQSAQTAAWSAAQSAAWSAAQSAAWSARTAAWSAAQTAAESAQSATWSAQTAAWSAAESAQTAAWSAQTAAWSAQTAAWSAAQSAAWSAQNAAQSAAQTAAESARTAAYTRYAQHLLMLLRQSQ